MSCEWLDQSTCSCGSNQSFSPWSSSQSVCVNVFVISGNIFYVLGEILSKWILTWNRIGVYSYESFEVAINLHY